MKSKDVLIALYQERSSLATWHNSLMEKETAFFMTLILAMMTIPIALFGNGVNNKIFLSVFPFFGILFSISGFLTLKRESEGFYKSLYALSVIRNSLAEDLNEILPDINFNNSPSRAELARGFRKIGIYHINLDKYKKLSKYLKDNVFRLRSNRMILYLMYLLFVLVNIGLICYFISC